MILLTHNRYRSSSPSGENIAVDRQTDLLTAQGEQVEHWQLSSDEFVHAGRLTQLRLAYDLAGSKRRQHQFTEHIKQAQSNGAELLHLHNPWPGFSYDVAISASAAKMPLVQTLHNYRLLGSNDRLIDGGHLRRPLDVAEQLHLARMANNHNPVANMAYNRALNLWWKREVPQKMVSVYICLTTFQQKLAIAAGIPAERTIVLPNFVHHNGPVGDIAGDYALFVGRLDHTKGIDWLRRWWPEDGPVLRVVGDGPLADCVGGHPRIQALGRCSFKEVQNLMSKARLVVMASTWYEPFGLVIIEALAAGTPCLVPDLGGMSELIEDGTNGVVMPAYHPDDPLGSDNAARMALARAWDLAPQQRAAARQAYELNYTPDVHWHALNAIYTEIRNGR